MADPQEKTYGEEFTTPEQVIADQKRKKAEQKAYDKANMDSELATPTKEKEPPRKLMPSEMAGGYKKGGSVKSSASRRGDGCAQRGKTRGRIV